MKKKIFALLAAVVFIALCLSVVIANINNQNDSAKSLENEDSVKDAAAQPYTFDETFVTEAMTADEFASSIRYAMHNGLTSFTFSYTDGQYKSRENLNFDALRAGLDTACEDYAQYATFYADIKADIQDVKGGYSIDVKLIPEDDVTQEQLKADIKDFDEKISELIDSFKESGTITSDMTYLEIARTLYDYTAENYEYDVSYADATSYKSLIDGKAVCEGYTSIYNALCQQCGLAMRACFGYSRENLHEWSELLVDGSIVYFDVTFHDAQTDDGTPQYFNITLEELMSLDTSRSLRSYWS